MLLDFWSWEFKEHNLFFNNRRNYGNNGVLVLFDSEEDPWELDIIYRGFKDREDSSNEGMDSFAGYDLNKCGINICKMLCDLCDSTGKDYVRNELGRFWGCSHNQPCGDCEYYINKRQENDINHLGTRLSRMANGGQNGINIVDIISLAIITWNTASIFLQQLG